MIKFCVMYQLNQYDSIQMYLREIGQYSLVSAADERDLARRIALGENEAKNILARAKPSSCCFYC